MKKLLSLLALVTLLGCRPMLTQPMVVDVIQINQNTAAPLPYKYVVTFRDYAGDCAYLYTNTKYNVGDTLK